MNPACAARPMASMRREASYPRMDRPSPHQAWDGALRPSSTGSTTIGATDVTAGSTAPFTRESRLEPSSRSEEHTAELQSLMSTSSAVLCLQIKKKQDNRIE